METSTKSMSDEVFQLKLTRTIGGCLVVALALVCGTCAAESIDDHHTQVLIKNVEAEKAITDAIRAAAETERARITADRDKAVIEQMKQAEKKP